MLRTLFLSRNISLRASAAAVATSGVTLMGLVNLPTQHVSRTQRLSFSSDIDKLNGNTPVTASDTTLKVAGIVVTAEEKAANDLLWEEKARSCPLCRLFLDSPCAEEFKLFSDCADRAKESGEEVSTACGEGDFVKMRRCMEEYPEHFELLFEAEEGIVSDDEDDFEAAPSDTDSTSSSTASQETKS